MRWCHWQSSLAALAAFTSTVTAQTWTDCNPLHGSCPANIALGMTINVDFRNGEVDSFASSGKPTYDDADGARFTVAQGGDAPQLGSLFTIMFGRVEITMKAAPGAGIVSSLVLESDTLDEIDIEWLGSNPDEMQSNYFGKGQTTTYNRGQFHELKGTQTEWITYTIDWTEERIVWMADGTVMRELAKSDAEEGQYPQTPMQVKFGSWAGGDPNHNPPGTVKWARGPTDYSEGPFTMSVQTLSIVDYSTGKKYSYSDNSGTWESIEAEDGEINGNIDNEDAITVTATAPGSAVTTDVSVPVGGIADDGSSATVTQTGWPWEGDSSPTDGAIPAGWFINEEGKLEPSTNNMSSSVRPPPSLVLLLTPLVGALVLRRRIL